MTAKETSQAVIMMIRPVRFGYNAETALNNAFQVNPEEVEPHSASGAAIQVQEKALQEFDAFAARLQAADIPLLIVEDTPDPHTPDSIFPNNWISFHKDGQVVLYPMFAENRRKERKPGVLQQLEAGFAVKNIYDLSHYEADNRFLEGTGSFVLDRTCKIAYACLSPRTDEALFREFCATMDYRPVVFHAFDPEGTAIYHTNVMMCIADRYAVINLDCIPQGERDIVRKNLEDSGKIIVPISPVQMAHFAGNMLQVRDRSGKTHLVMSSQAYASLDPAQITLLNRFDPIIHTDLGTIERNGGGSARCMLAEIYLPVLSQSPANS